MFRKYLFEVFPENSQKKPSRNTSTKVFLENLNKLASGISSKRGISGKKKKFLTYWIFIGFWIFIVNKGKSVSLLNIGDTKCEGGMKKKCPLFIVPYS